MFTKLLIANRGEIACRIIKTTRRMGIESVAVYSETDLHSLAVKEADHAYFIGPSEAQASYLNIDAIIAAALDSGAQAIHPGYGFLSENPAMARACAKAGLVFIGPPPAAMEAMASKQTAKQRLEKTNVPLTPGYHGSNQSDKTLYQEALQLGFPVLLKAASGGGGKGMRAVHHAVDFYQALAGARREALASFSDDTMLIEKLLERPRHVEIQIMADNHGHIVHLHERDCSIQRRHQKIIEEAPAPNLSKRLRQQLGEAAVTVAKTIDYRGAGTVEFLVDGEHFYFMEMNTRLQVEHPVTECITGLDLIEWQLRIAANEPLPLTQKEVPLLGHAIECRIYAEDPYHDFIPSMGNIDFLVEPIGTGLRLDTGIALHATVSRYYDPMLSKLIAFGQTREEALLRLQNGLQHYHLGGIKTNISFLSMILKHPRFVGGDLSTHFLTEHSLATPTPDKQWVALVAAALDELHRQQTTTDPLLSDTMAWQMHLQPPIRSRYFIDTQIFEVEVIRLGPHTLRLTQQGTSVLWQVSLSSHALLIHTDQQVERVVLHNTPLNLTVFTPEGPLIVLRSDPTQSDHAPVMTNNPLMAPMPATVVAVFKQIGESIKMGEPFMVLEAMKMEHTLHAPYDGLLVDIFYDIGAQVDEGALLVTLDKVPS